MTAAAPPQLTSTQRTRATIDNVLGITARERQLEDQERYGAPAGRLMLTVLSGIAEFERDLILQRTNEGRLRAMAEGTRFGRKPKLTKHQAREALKRVAEGEPLREIVLSYNVDHSTICRLKPRYAVEA